MPNIKSVGTPVFMTKNEHSRYAIPNIQDFEKKQATLQLMNELVKYIKSSKEKGWFTLENQEKLFEAGIVVFKLVIKRIKNKL